MAAILFIDDDVLNLRLVEKMLRRARHSVETADSLAAGFAKAAEGVFDVILLDIFFPDGNGIAWLERFRSIPSYPEIILITGNPSHEDVESAFNKGAFDYLVKPLNSGELAMVVDKAIQHRNRRMAAGRGVRQWPREHGIVGSGARMRRVLDQVETAAPSLANVLISGKTGTGKELFAQAIHAASPRHTKPFVTVDCATLPESLAESILFGHERGAFTGAEKTKPGLIQQADGGTLFLDEIGELPLSLQKVFLRVLQERTVLPLGGKQPVRVDFRLIAATNRNLSTLAEKEAFRSDLYFRLRSIEIELPPLKDRREDIRELVLHHAVRLCQLYSMAPKQFSSCFFEAMERYDWPGNVRELVNVLERVFAVTTGDTQVSIHDLPRNIRIRLRQYGLNKADAPAIDCFRPMSQPLPGRNGFPSLLDARSHMERQYLEELLRSSGGSRKKACELADISRTRLFELLRKHQLPRGNSNLP